jgi:hypothetical protein
MAGYSNIRTAMSSIIDLQPMNTVRHRHPCSTRRKALLFAVGDMSTHDLVRGAFNALIALSGNFCALDLLLDTNFGKP